MKYLLPLLNQKAVPQTQANEPKYSDLCKHERESVKIACSENSKDIATLCPLLEGMLGDCMKFRNNKMNRYTK